MYIIKLDAIDSTNSYLKKMISTRLLKDYTVVVTEHQTAGRGQMGTVWYTDSGKNLTASVFKKFSNIKADEQFGISMVTALAIIRTLKSFHIQQLKIKWPNDILSADKKLCGILIENILKNNDINASIIGLGLNINQKEFTNLPRASSMTLITGVVYNKDEILNHIIKNLKYYFNLLNEIGLSSLKTEYEKFLFRKDKPSTFKTINQDAVTGIIEGVTDCGKLMVRLEDNILKSFDLKEISLLY